MSDPITFDALGTTASLVVTDDRVGEDARAILVAEIEAIDTACSRFRSDSELVLVNAAAGSRRACPACSSRRSRLRSARPD